MKHDDIREMIPAEIAETIGVPLADWPGQCAAIAHLFVENGIISSGPTERYGHYRGPVAEGSLFFKRPIIQHGWLELYDESVLDPLRWEFEQVDAYLWVSKSPEVCEDYDIGGNKVRSHMAGPCPPVDKANALYPLPRGEIQWLVLAQIPNAMEDTVTRVDSPVLAWFANLPPTFFESTEDVTAIYRWIMRQDRAALIPIDNRRLILGDV